MADVHYDPGYGPLVETRVRVATWNIWARYGPWQERMPAIIETLRRVDADIIGLQEVWDDGVDNQARLLADELGLPHHVFAPNLVFDDGVRAGNAIISRWPIARSVVRTLPRHAGDAVDEEGEERLCVFAEIDGPRGLVQMFCAHLSWRDDHSAVRQEQVRDICRFVRETRPRTFPAILVGDLNAEPHSDELRMLTGRSAVPVPGILFRDAWEVAGGGAPGSTWSNGNAFARASLNVDQRIDHVLVGRPKLGGAGHVLAVSVAGDEPVGGMLGSDHYAVVAELRY